MNDVRPSAELRTVEISDEFAQKIKQGLEDYEHARFNTVDAKSLQGYLSKLAETPS